MITDYDGYCFHIQIITYRQFRMTKIDPPDHAMSATIIIFQN